MIKAKLYKYLTEDSNLSIKVIAAYTPKNESLNVHSMAIQPRNQILITVYMHKCEATLKI